VADESSGEVESEEVTWTSYSSKPAGTIIIQEEEYQKLAVDTTTIYSIAAIAAAIIVLLLMNKWRAVQQSNDAIVAAVTAPTSGKGKGGK